MNLKLIIKNLMPFFVVKYFQRNKNNKPSYTPYVSVGNSILTSNFNLDLSFPISGKKYVHIGNDCMLNCSIRFDSSDGEIKIGDRVFMGRSTIICKSKIEFGNNIFVAWGSYFYDHDSHSIDYKFRQADISQQLLDYKNNEIFTKNKNWDVVNVAPIKICDNAWIGMNCIILKGVTIGEGAIVGAGSVVTKSVLPWTIVGGNPAKVIKEIPIDKRKKS